ncbi:MAG: hypothetical protein CMJ65_09060 [Planctomycetaceae bacterium]|jgi:hypothetical protein|nr:hypothetical protein [Planctomycetaceae bacterium]
MNWKQLFLRDGRHLRILACALIALGVVTYLVQGQMIPETFGDLGPYRAAALEELKSRPSVLQSDATCLKCHDHVGEERAESPHKSVGCLHCHGIGRKHVEIARRAEKSEEIEIPAVEEWDGNPLTKVDLYVAHNKQACLSCHGAVVGMPEAFRKIVVADHLEEVGALDDLDEETIKSKGVCLECHGNHDPAP